MLIGIKLITTIQKLFYYYIIWEICNNQRGHHEKGLNKYLEIMSVE